MKFSARRQRSRSGLKIAGLALGSVLALAGLAAVTVYIAYQQIGENYDLAKLSQAPARSDIYDANGRLLTRMQNNGSRLTAKLKDVSPHLIDALRLDNTVMVRELARDAFSLGDGSLHRRMVVRAVAGRIQARYSRDEILEFYLNRIYLGAGVYGVEAAARKYFGKPSAGLNLAEAAALAGLRRDEGRETPVGRDAVLDRMAARGDITNGEAAAAKTAPTLTGAGRFVSAQDDEIAAAVRGELDRAVPAEQIKRGGLRVYTTIDPGVQCLAAQAIDEQITQMESASGYTLPTRAGYAARVAQGDKAAAPDYLQGALVAIDNRTGAIVALAGGRDYDESRSNRALDVRRPVGSAFQPFVYAAAVSSGLPQQEKTERPVGFTRVSNAARTPQAALEAVQVLARRVGFDQAASSSAFARGQFAATPRELAAAYTVFPNSGVVRAPYLIERIDSADGSTIYLAAHPESRAFDERTAQSTAAYLARADKGGASSQKISLELSAPVIGQPGVSAGSKDAWFVGCTSSLTCAVWVGLDQPRPITARNDGVNPAMPIWTEFMRETARSAKRYPALAFAGAEVPAAVVPAAFNYTEPAAAKSASLPPKIQQAIAPEPEVSTAPPVAGVAPLSAGSRYIRDEATGRVIGIDGSEGVAEAELTPVRVASPVVVRRAQPVAPDDAPLSDDPADQASESYGFTGARPAPVRRALPVAPAQQSFDVSAWRAANLEASRVSADLGRASRARAAVPRYP